MPLEGPPMEVKEFVNNVWQPVSKEVIRFYRISSGGSYRMMEVPNRSTNRPDYEKLFKEGFMSEPAYRRIQELTGFRLVPEEARQVESSALAEIAAREPSVPVESVLPGNTVMPQSSPRKKPGRKSQKGGGE